MREDPEHRLLGMENMRYLFFEQSSGGGRDDMEATLSFDGTRTGIASWLAAPGAAGSAEYVSDEAIVVASGSTRNPRQAFDEILSLEDGKLAGEIQKLETETGVSLGDDVASALGTDFTFAVVQPSLPLPGWVVVCEVVNPGALDEAVAGLVDAYNRNLTPEQTDWQISITQETVNGRLWSAMKSAGSPRTLYWTYDRGYLVVSLDRAVATRAVAVRDAGSSLTRSARFQQSYPVTASLHSSGFFWLNTNGVLAEVATFVSSPALQRLAGSRDPVLVVVDGETERIHAASRTRLTSLILDLMLLRGAGAESPDVAPATAAQAPLQERKLKAYGSGSGR
jgi:hypothetical protein